MFKYKKNTLPILFRALLGGVIFVTSLNWVGAQSSSASYQAVDFLNPEASLSTSGNYVLNDSVDYYGGVHTSANYNECTGDFAVLSGCVPPVAPPPPPPPPPPGGGGGGGPTNICDYVDCDTPEDESPVIDEVVIEPEPFKLPDIKEPVKYLEPVVVPEDRPVVIMPEAEVVAPAEVDTAEAIRIAGLELLRKVAPEYCYDLTCSEVNVFRPVAADLQKNVDQTCRLYTFGGYMIAVPCSDVALIWLALILMIIAPIPIGLFEVHMKLRTLKKKG